MPNMSYCRFQNTVVDMQECIDAIEENGNLEDFIESLSDEEKHAFDKFIQLGIYIADLE